MEESNSRMGAIGLRLYRSLRSYRRMVFGLTGVLLLICTLGITRLHPGQDAHSLVAEADETSANTADLLARFGTLNTLLLDLSKEGASPEEVEALGDVAAARLEESGAFRTVLFRVSAEEDDRYSSLLFEHRFHLFPLPENLQQGAEAARRDLMLPGAGAEPIVARDPTAIRDQIPERLERERPALRLDMSRGTLLSKDHQHALLILEPKLSAIDPSSARETLKRVDEAVPEGATSRVLGPQVLVDAAATSLRRDIWLTVTTASLGLLLLFALVFRSLGPALAVSLPLVFGGLTTAGLIGWLDVPIHGFTLGFGAMVIGIGINYSAQLVIQVRAFRRDLGDQPPEMAVEQALIDVSPSIGLGALTTLAAFGALSLSGIAALGQILLFTGLGISTIFLFCILVLPLALERTGTARMATREHTPWKPIPVLVGAGLGTLLLSFGLHRAQFDGDWTRFDHQSPELAAVEAELHQRWANPRLATLVIASGKDTQQALRRADRVCDLLRVAKSRRDVTSYTGLCRVLPSHAKQRRILETWQGETIAQSIDATLRAAELEPAGFEPFRLELADALLGGTGPLGAADLVGTAFEPVVERMLVEKEGETHVMAVAEMSSDEHKELPTQLRDALSALPGVSVVSAPHLARHGAIAIKRAIVPLSLVSLFLVALILAIYYRRLAPALLAMAPTAFAFVWTCGMMGWIGIPFDIVNLSAFGLVAAIGVDYGIFVTDAALLGETKRMARSRRAVLMAATATLVSCGALLLARSPVMWSLGFVVGIGVSTSLLVATLILPAVLERWDFLGLQESSHPPCSTCGVQASPAPDPAAWVQLFLLLILAILVTGAWFMGARAMGGWQSLGVLSADACWIAWIGLRLHRRPVRCGCTS